jgi:MoxR-like ATPase
MQTMHLANVSKLAMHVAIRLNEPLMIVGRFGIGKSAIINALRVLLSDKDALDGLLGEAHTYVGTMICDVRLSQYESVDLRGFPGVNRDTGFTVWHAPATLPFIGNDEFPDDHLVILFLDEITSANQSVASVAYQLSNERRIGEHVLKPNVRIICAGNRDDDKGIVNRMPMPLCNRMTWVEAISDHHVWCDWAQEQGVHPIMLAFMHFKPNLLMTYDPNKAEKVVATSRTWEKAAKYFVDKQMDDELKWAAIGGSIGNGPATELRAFLNVWQKVTPIKDIIANPETIPVPAEASMRYATAISISGAMSPKNLTPLYTFLKRMQPEMIVLAWQMAGKRDQSLYKTPEFIDFTKRYRSVFSL